MSNLSFDVIVIGSGPGGYVCAIRAAQLGLNTAIIEKDPQLGGTCLNVGCIPSKALLHSSEVFYEVKKHGKTQGIVADGLRPDVASMLKNKDSVVRKLNSGVQQLVGKRGITILHGKASLMGGGKVLVENETGGEAVEGKNIIIATGSVPVELPFLPFDGKMVVSSTEALKFEEVPESLAVVGGGAIGLEMGSVWARLGAKVSILEFLPSIAPGCDPDMAKLVARIYKKQGIDVHVGTQVTGYKEMDGKVYVSAEQNEKPIEIEAEKILVAVGRKPFTEGLGLENVNIELDERGRIPVDKEFKTSAEGVYAIGDVIAGPMLAHKAEEEGVALAEILAGQAGHVNYDVIPGVIYTDPEVATVGLSETAASEKGIRVKVGKFGMAANGRALAMNATEGMVKVIADAETDKLLGVQVIAKNASEIIGSAVTHMEYGGSAEDMARTIVAHPTMSEALKEAAMAVDGNSIHSL